MTSLDKIIIKVLSALSVVILVLGLIFYTKETVINVGILLTVAYLVFIFSHAALMFPIISILFVCQDLTTTYIINEETSKILWNISTFILLLIVLFIVYFIISVIITGLVKYTTDLDVIYQTLNDFLSQK